MSRTKHLPFILAALIPVLVIVGVLVAIKLPSVKVKPQYNFLYKDDQSYDYLIDIKDNRLQVERRYPDEVGFYDSLKEMKFFVYDVETDRSKRVTLEEAKKIELSNQPVSPDGYQVVKDNGGDGIGFFPILFMGGSDYGVYIKQGKNKKKIELLQDGYYQFEFVGWIIGESSRLN